MKNNFSFGPIYLLTKVSSSASPYLQQQISSRVHTHTTFNTNRLDTWNLKPNTRYTLVILNHHCSSYGFAPHSVHLSISHLIIRIVGNSCRELHFCDYCRVYLFLVCCWSKRKKKIQNKASLLSSWSWEKPMEPFYSIFVTLR